MKILAVTRRFPPDTFGGGEISVHQWCQLLAGENEVHVLTTGKGDVQCNEMVVHRAIPQIMHTWPLDLHNNEIFYMKSYKSLRKLLKNEKFDIIHAFNMNTIPPVVKAAKKRNIPAIATVNDHWGTCYFRSHFHKGRVREVCTSSILKQNLKKNDVNILAYPYIYYTMGFRQRSMQRCTRLIAISSWVKRILEKNGFSNVKEIFNPVDLFTFNSKKFQSTGNVLYIGRLDKGKGLETLFESVAKAQEIVSFNLIIAGTGNTKFYKQLAESHNISADFIGKVPYSKVPSLIHNSDLVVSSFERVEAFGRSIAEANACGRTVITTNIAGGMDIIEDQKNGLIIPPQDPIALEEALIGLLTNKNRLESMGIEGRRIVEKKLNPKVLLEKLLNVYESVLKG